MSEAPVPTDEELTETLELVESGYRLYKARAALADLIAADRQLYTEDDLWLVMDILLETEPDPSEVIDE